MAGKLACIGFILLSALPSCALLPPTKLAAFPTAPQRPEGPGEHVVRNSQGETTSTVEYWVDERGDETRHGVEAVYWPGGKLKAHREFEHGSPSGHWQTFWRDGTVRSDYSIEQDRPTPMVYFHSNGSEAARGEALAGQRVGPWKYWYASGKLAEEGVYGAGKREGLWRTFSEEGELREEVRYEAGQRIAK